MLPCNARKNSQGFTMIEIIIILLIIGILSAIAAPSFLAMHNRAKLNDAVTKVRGALQEAQREAIRKSKSCFVTLDTTNNKVTGIPTPTPSPTPTPTFCLVTGERTLADDGVSMATNVKPNPIISGNPIQIQFDIRGNTTFTVATAAASATDTSGKIILYMSDGSISDKKCVAISKGIGLLRFGTYSGPIDSAANITDVGTCNASQ